MSALGRSIVLGVFILASYATSAQEYPHVTRGTLVTAMGNKQGIVLMTDSMVTYTDASGRSRQAPKQPRQKLMRYNDKWVCATAGLLSVTKPNLSPQADTISPQFQFQVMGLIKFYADAMRTKDSSQSMADALSALSALLRQHFSIHADMDAALGKPEEKNAGDYRLELFLAGFDTDGQPKIGRIDISVRSELWSDGKAHWVAVEKENDCKLRTIKSELTVCQGGIDTIEKDMLANPDKYKGPSVMEDFIIQMKKDRGASLTTDEMTKLGHLFKVETSYREAAVGGLDQVATITRGQIRLEGIDGFAPVQKPSPMVIVPCPTGTSFHASSFLNLPSNHVPILYQHCAIFEEEHQLDGNIYVQCTFRDSNLYYSGGDTLFGPDNQIEGKSSLFLGPASCRRPDVVAQLQKRFDVFHGGSISPIHDGSGNLPPGAGFCDMRATQDIPQPQR
jgi:hypothetical protein